MTRKNDNPDEKTLTLNIQASLDRPAWSSEVLTGNWDSYKTFHRYGKPSLIRRFYGFARAKSG